MIQTGKIPLFLEVDVRAALRANTRLEFCLQSHLEPWDCFHAFTGTVP